MTVSELMTQDFAWISPEASVASAARALASAPPGVVCLLVGTRDAPPHGIVTAIDVLRAALETAIPPGRLCPEKGRLLGTGDLGEADLFERMACAAALTPVRAIMSSPARTLDRRSSLAQAVDLIIRGRIEAAPVTADGRVVGILHQRALLHAVGAVAARA